MTTLIKTLLKWNINFYPTSCVDSCFREMVKKTNKQNTVILIKVLSFFNNHAFLSTPYSECFCSV